MEKTEKVKTNETLKRNIVLNTVFRILMIIAPFLTAPYISRVLLSDGVGVYSYTQSLVTYATMFAALGTVSYGTREIARRRDNKDDYSKAFWEIEILSIICSSICIVIWLIFSLCYTEYKVYLLIFGFSIISTMLDISWLFAGLEKYQYTVSINLIFKLLSVVFIFLFVKKPSDVWIYILIYSSSLALGNGSMWLFLPKFVKKTKIEKTNILKHFKETLVYFIPTIAASLYTVLDKTLIGSLIAGETTVVLDGVETTKKISELENGYYEQATKIIDLVKAVCFVSINAVVYSRASYLYKVEDTEEIKKLTTKTFHVVMFLSIGAAFGLFGIAPFFVPLFFGAGYDKTIILLRILAVLVPIICLSGTLGSLYFSPVGKRKQSALFLVIGAVINLLISAPLVIYFRSIGAAIASLIAELAITILYFAFCKKTITFKGLFEILWKKVVAGALMLGVLVLLNRFVKSHISNEVIYLIFSVVAGLLIYIIVLTILRDQSITFFFNTVKGIKNKFVVSAAKTKKEVKPKGRISFRNVLFLLLVAISSGGGIACAYLYGTSQASTKFYSVLMSVDSEVKKQKNTDFLHGSLSYNGEKTESSLYTDLLNLQRRTKSQYFYYNSYLVSSQGDEYLNYSVDYGLNEDTIKHANLIEVSTFYDWFYMESVGLPLFRVGETASKITSKNGATYGAYISATSAEEIVANNGMLAAANNDLASAFNLLLDNQSYVFYLSNNVIQNGSKISFSVNNIYIDPNHNEMLSTFQNQVQNSRYGNYSRSFDYWFSNPILTFSTEIFNKGCSYVFDIRRNYGNLDRFFTNVVGYDFASNNYSINLFREIGDLYNETQELNQASREMNSQPNYIYLIFGIILFIFSGVCFELLSKFFAKKKKLLLAFMPSICFVVFQAVFYVLLAAGIYKYSLYLFFNSTGNIICLLFLALTLINAIIWSNYVKKRER